VVAGLDGSGEGALVQVAAGLIDVEDHLDDQLVGLILPRKKGTDGTEPESEDQDFHQVQSAVLRECVVNLARIKEYVAQNVGGTLDAAGFDSWPELMRGIKAGLLMLGKTRAVEIIEDITQHLKRVMQPGGVALPPDYLDRLADAIVSLEYYIETLQAGRSDPWYMLDNARTCLDALAHAPERVLPTVTPVETTPATYARTLLIAPPVAGGDTADLPRPPLPVPEPPVLEAAAEHAAHLRTSPDPELIGLFIDEAGEEVAKIREQFPIWDHNPLESEPLLTVRRSFHTLKGSGRMVNARALSEFAWAIENLLNRILEGTQQRSLPVLETLRAAVNVLPALVDDLKSGHSGRTDVSRLSARAHALASGRDPSAPPEPAPAPLPPPFASDSVTPGSGLALPRAAAAMRSPAATERAPPAPTASNPTASTPPAPAAFAQAPPAEAPPAPAPVAPLAMEPGAAVEGTIDVLLPEWLPEAPPLAATAAVEPAPKAAPNRLPPDSGASARAPNAVDSSEASSTAQDPALREIYARETASHVATVGVWIAREQRHPAPHVLPEEVYRACHTLVGSSTMAEARHGMRLAEPINHWLRKSYDSGVGLDDSDLALLADCMRAMETVAGNLDEGTGFFVVVHDTLRARIARAEADLDRCIAEANDIAQLSSVSLQMLALPDVPEVQPEPPAPVAATPPVPSVPAPVAEPPAADFDPEIASIFSEEAVELLEAAENALEAWNAAPHDSSQAAALRRPLHTLKGGARMAGVVAMGDLSHELESLITRIETGLVSADDTARGLAQQVLDELSKMRDVIAEGRPVASAPGLLARIRAAGTPAADAAAAAVVEIALPPPPPPAAAPPPPAAAAVAAEPVREVPPAEISMTPPSGVVDRPLRFDSPTLLEEAELAQSEEAVATPPRTEETEATFEAVSSPASQWPIEPPSAALEALLPAEPPLTLEIPQLNADFMEALAPADQTGILQIRPFELPPELMASETRATEAAIEPVIEPEVEAGAPAPPVSFALPASVAPPTSFAPSASSAPSMTVAPPATASPPREWVAPPAERPAAARVGEQPSPPAPLPPGREPVTSTDRVEMARVSAELLDQLLNNAGEVSIARARLEQQLGSIEFNLGELSRTVIRLKEQLRKLEIETEAQILHRHESDSSHRQDFDPLELDRYSSIQQFSRALAESANDVASIQGLLENLIGEAQNLLQQQSRTVTELQNGLMRTRMVSLQRHVPRLARIVRQSATDSGKRAELIVDGASGELDRQVLERMLPPFEHMLRNAVVHGIEASDVRRAAGKDETGHIRLTLRREGAEVIVEVSDDGAGMNLGAIRNKGLELGLIRPDQELSDEDVMQLVLEPGFSTASALTQEAGRGVGMDVAAVEIKKLGGALHMESTAGRGTRFTIRLPFTLAISHALVVRAADEFYALPLPTVEGVVRIPRSEVEVHLRSETASFAHGGQKYRLQPLALYVGMEPSPLPEQDVTIPVILVRAGEHSTGLVADELIGSREIVVKPVGPQISSIRGISGATILGDGRIVIILDIGALVRSEWRGRTAPTVTRDKADRRTFALVVDDSITVRRVTQRLLERNGMRVLTARDGMDAVALLAEHVPDIILLDIEMPRMDGYEVAAHVRADPRLRDVPIIMITSRVGEKHRARAIDLGVDDYLGKPYQESQLLDAITPLVAQRRASAVASGSGR